MPTGVSPVAIASRLAALVAGVLMLLTEVTTVISIDVAAGSCDSIYDTSPDLADDCDAEGLRALLGGPAPARAAHVRDGRREPRSAARGRPRWRWSRSAWWCSGITLLVRPARERRHRPDRPPLRRGGGDGGHRAVARAGRRGAGGGGGARAVAAAERLALPAPFAVFLKPSWRFASRSLRRALDSLAAFPCSPTGTRGSEIGEKRLLYVVRAAVRAGRCWRPRADELLKPRPALPAIELVDRHRATVRRTAGLTRAEAVYQR